MFVQELQLSKSETMFIGRFGSNSSVLLKADMCGPKHDTRFSVHVHVQSGEAPVREYLYPVFVLHVLLFTLGSNEYFLIMGRFIDQNYSVWKYSPS